MASAAATLVETEDAGSLVLAAGRGMAGGDAPPSSTAGCSALELPQDRRVTIDLAGVDRIDSAGAWLLLRTEHDLSARGNAVELRNLRPSFAPLFEQVRAGGRRRPGARTRGRRTTRSVGFVARIGEISLGLLGPRLAHSRLCRPRLR